MKKVHLFILENIFYLQKLAIKREPWLLLAMSALILEMCALCFQYVLNLDPCVMCIYERIPVIGLFMAGLIGASVPKKFFVRFSAFSIWIVSAIWGLTLSVKHVGYQLNPSSFEFCAFYPNFPAWLPLHKWFPWFFNPTGDCADIVWKFLDYSMPQWLIVIFGVYILAFIIVLSSVLSSRGR